MLIWVAVGFLACILVFLLLAATAPMLTDDHTDGDQHQEFVPDSKHSVKIDN